MNKIEQLLEKYCPEGVEFKSLWEVTTWDKKFNSVANHKQPKVIKYKYFLASKLKSLIVDWWIIKVLTTNISNLFTNEELAWNDIAEWEIIAIPWWGNPVVQYYKGKFLTSDNRIATSNDISILDNKFLYYYLLNNIDLLSSFYRWAWIKHPNMSKVLDLNIPIPPIEIQQEIVKILDTFTQLEAELEAELEARKKQYEYYRDEMLSFEDDEVEWKELGEVWKVITWRTPNNKQQSYWWEGINFITPSDMKSDSKFIYNTSRSLSLNNETKEIFKNNLLPKKSILVSCIGSDMWKTFMNWNDAITNQQINSIIINIIDIYPDYIYHYLASKKDSLKKIARSGWWTMPIINKTNFSQIKVPIPFKNWKPDLEKQQEIVDILDKFDALVNDISSGLPAEIKARKQQYEYYREKLLTFKELKK